MDNRELKLRREMKSFAIKYKEFISTGLLTDLDDKYSKLNDLISVYKKRLVDVKDALYIRWVLNFFEDSVHILPIPKILIIYNDVIEKDGDEILSILKRGGLELKEDVNEKGNNYKVYNYVINKYIIDIEVK